MTCEVARTHLPDYMDEALPEERMAEVREHVENCEPCRDLCNTLHAADRLDGFGGRSQADA